VRPVGVVLDAPGLDDGLGFEQGIANSSTLKCSSRARLLKDSAKGFSHGEPGSM